MRLLLDTHVFLWLITEPERLPAEVLDRIRARDTELFVSMASAWEIAIKHRLGKLPMPDAPDVWIPQQLEAMRARLLPIALEHALADVQLPPIHRDPFDRMLAAQALVEGLTLCTADRALADYPVAQLRAR